MHTDKVPLSNLLDLAAPDEPRARGPRVPTPLRRSFAAALDAVTGALVTPGLFAAAALVAYCAGGHVVGEFYPVSPLAMFDHAATSASRVVVIDADGREAAPSDFEGWRCDAQIDLAARARALCGPTGYSPLDNRAEHWMWSHAAEPGDDPGEQVQVVRREYEIASALDNAVTRDCVVLHCRATRRAGR